MYINILTYPVTNEPYCKVLPKNGFHFILIT